MEPIKELKGKTVGIVGLGSSQLEYNLAKSHGQHFDEIWAINNVCLLYTSPSPRDVEESRMPSSA